MTAERAASILEQYTAVGDQRDRCILHAAQRAILDKELPLEQAAALAHGGQQTARMLGDLAFEHMRSCQTGSGEVLQRSVPLHQSDVMACSYARACATHLRPGRPAALCSAGRLS